MKNPKQGLAPALIIQAPFDASGSLWVCDPKVPGRLQSTVDRIDKELRAYGAWKAGSHFRIESGDVQLIIQWTGDGDPEVFDATAFEESSKAIQRYAVATALHERDAESAVHEQEMDEALQALQGKDMRAVEALVDVLASEQRPLQVQIGEERTPVTLAGSQLALPGARLSKTSLRVATREDYLLITTEDNQCFLVKCSIDTEGLQVGDDVEFRDAVTLEFHHCIRAVEALRDQAELFPESAS